MLRAMPAHWKHTIGAALLAAAATNGCATSDDAAPAQDRAAAEAEMPAAIAALPRVEHVAYADDGLPYLIRGELGRASAKVTDLAGAQGALAPALRDVAAAFDVNADDLRVVRVHQDNLGMTHVRYQQHKNGLRVVGGDFVVHMVDGEIRVANGTARDGGVLPSVAGLDARAAGAIAQAATEGGEVDVARAELTYVISSRDASMHLAWEVEVLGRRALLDDLVYVDAIDGKVVDRRPQVFTARNRVILDGQGQTYPFIFEDTPQVGSEGSPPTGDSVALAAYDNTGKTYDCYQELFGRDSYDGAGATLESLIHIDFFTGQGTTPNNAAWTGQGMVYGDGDGNFMGPTPEGFDVTAHELTHGVTSATANLAYEGESGALNEAMSDIMAAVCESWRDGAISANTWLVGEEIFTPSTPGDALRYMADPKADADILPPEFGGSSDYYPNRYMGDQDNGGVHINSGIANLAFQLLVDGGTHPRDMTNVNVPSIGMEKAGAIFQRALTEGYFTSNTNFAQARTATETVAGELHPETESAVGLAWAAVGVGDSPAADTTPPTVQITAPSDGATVEAGFTVEVAASDDVGVLRVELTVDGVAAGSDTSAPYSFPTAATLAAGAHTIEATAFDTSNEASDSITVTIGDDGGGDDTGDNGGDDDGGVDGGCGCQSSGDPAGALGQLALIGAAVLLGRRRRTAR